MISQPALPDALIVRCMDVMGKLSPNERDLIRIVVEIVQELRDPGVNLDEEADDVASTQLSFCLSKLTAFVAGSGRRGNGFWRDP